MHPPWHVMDDESSLEILSVHDILWYNIRHHENGLQGLPVLLLSAMAIACGGQVALDIRRHPHHRLFKM
jgi:hypothetical protein